MTSAFSFVYPLAMLLSTRSDSNLSLAQVVFQNIVYRTAIWGGLL